MVVVEEEWQPMSTFSHYFSSSIQGFLCFTSSNHGLFNYAQVTSSSSSCVWLRLTLYGPSNVVLHLPPVEVPDIGAKGCAVFLCWVYEGVCMVVKSKLES